MKLHDNNNDDDARRETPATPPKRFNIISHSSFFILRNSFYIKSTQITSFKVLDMWRCDYGRVRAISAIHRLRKSTKAENTGL